MHEIGKGKIYNCVENECNYNTRNKDNLKAHMWNIHNLGKGKIYQCTKCSYSTKNKGDLTTRHFHCKHCNIGCTKNRYSDIYCLPCYCILNPNKKIPRRYLVKETFIRKKFNDYISENDFKVDFEQPTCNKTLKACSQRQPDIFIDCYTHTIIIEIDEGQHKNYNTTCEITRVNELFTDCADRPIVFIRFNPDKYKINKRVIKGCFSVSEKIGKLKCNEKEFEKRFNKLIERFEYHIKTIPTDVITIEYLFYDDSYNNIRI